MLDNRCEAIRAYDALRTIDTGEGSFAEAAAELARQVRLLSEQKYKLRRAVRQAKEILGRRDESIAHIAERRTVVDKLGKVLEETE
jgi:hypothetical protein